MKLDYQPILKHHGFEDIPEPEDITSAFYYDIQNTLFESDSPFNFKNSKVIGQPSNRDSMIHCSLTVRPSKTIRDGVSYLMTQWHQSLTYSKPKYELIQRLDGDFGTDVHILLIADTTACSFLFRVTDDATLLDSAD